MDKKTHVCQNNVKKSQKSQKFRAALAQYKKLEYIKRHNDNEVKIPNSHWSFVRSCVGEIFA